MKTLIWALTTSVIAGFAPSAASAADLGYYDERDTVIERPAPVRERIVERRYYEPDYEYYDEGPLVTYYRRPYRRHYPYYAGYPYRFGPYYGRGHWRHHGRW
jgi:hypothetical protein